LPANHPVAFFFAKQLRTLPNNTMDELNQDGVSPAPVADDAAEEVVEAAPVEAAPVEDAPAVDGEATPAD